MATLKKILIGVCILVTVIVFLTFSVRYAYKYNLNKKCEEFLAASFAGTNQVAYDMTSQDFRKSANLSKFADLNMYVKNNFGSFVSKKELNFLKVATPMGTIATFQYMAKFQKKENVLISLVLIHENNQWVVQSVFYK